MAPERHLEPREFRHLSLPIRNCASGAVPLQASLNAVVESETTVNTVSTDQGEFTTVTIPIDGSYSFSSNVSMVFDSEGNRMQSREMLVTENSDGYFNVKT